MSAYEHCTFYCLDAYFDRMHWLLYCLPFLCQPAPMTEVHDGNQNGYINTTTATLCLSAASYLPLL